MGATRKEEDFVAHIEKTLALDPQASWLFIVDRLTTHMSASLVELVQRHCHISLDAEVLGIKGGLGILENMQTRQAFLTDPSHRIRFVYLPTHTSWLNQVEIWFSILVRRFLRPNSFRALEELQERLLAFIDYFNLTMAKPLEWTYAGRPLCQ